MKRPQPKYDRHDVQVKEPWKEPAPATPFDFESVFVADEPALAPPPSGDGLDIEDVFSLLLTGSKDRIETGERAEILGYLMPRVRGRAGNLRELGRRLGCGHETARRRIDRVRAEFAKELANFCRSARQAPQQ